MPSREASRRYSRTYYEKLKNDEERSAVRRAQVRRSMAAYRARRREAEKASSEITDGQSEITAQQSQITEAGPEITAAQSEITQPAPVASRVDSAALRARMIASGWVPPYTSTEEFRERVYQEKAHVQWGRDMSDEEALAVALSTLLAKVGRGEFP
jgi:hypothetical protein